MQNKYIFYHPCSDKIISIIIFIILSIFSVIHFIYIGRIWVAMLLLVIEIMVFDLIWRNIFSTIIIYNKEMVLRQGGVIWKHFIKNLAFNLQSSQIEARYLIRKNNLIYKSIKLNDILIQKQLLLTKYQVNKLDQLVSVIKELCPQMKYVNVDIWAYKKANTYLHKIRSAIYNIFSN